jgi:hypothetical protein
LLTVKLYGWSKAKPKAIFTGSANPDADKLSSSNLPTVQAALAQRSGVEKLSEPEALTRIGRGIHGMTVTNISEALTNAKAVSESQITATNVSLGRQAIMQSLRTIRLDQIAFGTMTLSEILRILSQEARQQDPSHQGINFLINSGPEMVANMDPLTGLSLVTNAAPIADLGSLRIPLSQTLTHVCLAMFWMHCYWPHPPRFIIQSRIMRSFFHRARHPCRYLLAPSMWMPGNYCRFCNACMGLTFPMRPVPLQSCP